MRTSLIVGLWLLWFGAIIAWRKTQARAQAQARQPFWEKSRQQQQLELQQHFEHQQRWREQQQRAGRCTIWRGVRYRGGQRLDQTATAPTGWDTRDMPEAALARCCARCRANGQCTHWSVSAAKGCEIMAGALRWETAEACEGCASGAGMLCQEPWKLSKEPLPVPLAKASARIRGVGRGTPSVLPQLVFLVPLSSSRRAQVRQLAVRLKDVGAVQGFTPMLVLAEQQDSAAPFNRGLLINVAYKEMLKLPHYRRGAAGMAPIVVHDVDNWAERPGALNYAQCLATSLPPVRRIYGIGKAALTEAALSSSKVTMGGIFCTSRAAWEGANGFATHYWGWGSEDVSLGFRLLHAHVPVYDDEMVLRPRGFYIAGNHEGQSCGVSDPNKKSPGFWEQQNARNIARNKLLLRAEKRHREIMFASFGLSKGTEYKVVSSSTVRGGGEVFMVIDVRPALPGACRAKSRGSTSAASLNECLNDVQWYHDLMSNSTPRAESGEGHAP